MFPAGHQVHGVYYRLAELVEKNLLAHKHFISLTCSWGQIGNKIAESTIVYNLAMKLIIVVQTVSSSSFSLARTVDVGMSVTK